MRKKNREEPFPLYKPGVPVFTVGMLIERLEEVDPEDFVMLSIEHPGGVECYNPLRMLHEDHYFIKLGKSVQAQFFLQEDFPQNIAHKMVKCVTLGGGHLYVQDVDVTIGNRLFGSKHFESEREGVAWLFESTKEFMENDETYRTEIAPKFHAELTYSQALGILRKHVAWIDLDGVY